MGLTGHILEVEVQLVRVPSPWICSESERVPDIDAFLDALEEAAAVWPLTVGWIDCLTGGQAPRARHPHRGPLGRARRGARKIRRRRSDDCGVPFELPSGLLNRFTVRAFNTLYYWKHVQRVKKGIVHPEAFFYPLDIATDWNRLYGRRGFTQYQCVLPDAAGPGAARRFLELLVAQGGASPLCVIKDCGPEGAGVLSFPQPGISIALDIPVRDRTQALVDALNELVIARRRPHLPGQGRLHARRALPRDGAARLAEFQRIRKKWDPKGRIRSAQSVRLFGDAPVKVAFLGATKGMGRALARRWRTRGDALFLLGRDDADLERSAADLEARGGRPRRRRRLRSRGARAVRGRARRRRRGARRLRHRRRHRRDPGARRRSSRPTRALVARVLGVNFANTVLFCEEARRRLLARGGGTLCVFSSVAGERGRKPVILYGAAKAGLSRYLEGLDHKFRAPGLRTVCVKPGFVKTGMTAGLKPPPFAGEPERRRRDRHSRHRSRHAGRLRAARLAADHARHPPAAAIRDAAHQVLTSVAGGS